MDSSPNSGQGAYEADDQIVLVERKDAAPSDAVGVALKAFVLSGSKWRIIGA